MKGVFASWFCEGLHKSQLCNQHEFDFGQKNENIFMLRCMREWKSCKTNSKHGVITSSRTRNVHICNCHS